MDRWNTAHETTSSFVARTPAPSSVTEMRSLVPMPLVRTPEAFSHPDWTFEVKHDGFRALAFIRGHRCVLQSRNRNTFTRWPMLCEEIAHAVRANDAAIDREIVCMEPDGRSQFRKLLYRAEWPYFLAFDLIRLEGRDLLSLPLVERKPLRHHHAARREPRAVCRCH